MHLNKNLSQTAGNQTKTDWHKLWSISKMKAKEKKAKMGVEAGMNLMVSDDEEDEEEIEPENEQDRAFLNDEVNENDPSFYRRLNMALYQQRRHEQRQRREEIAECEDLLFGQALTSDNKVLNELAEKLTEYLRELPVLGFNSGKYDLNAVK